MFPDRAGWDLNTQLLASIIDIQRWFQWVKLGCEGPAPDPVQRPGVQPNQGDHRRGRAKRSETNKELDMKLVDDEARRERVRQLFSGTNTGPVRDIRGMQ